MFDPEKPYSVIMGEGKPKYLQDGVKYDNRFRVVDTGEAQAPAEPPVVKKTEKPVAEPAPRVTATDSPKDDDEEKKSAKKSKKSAE